jgi:LmbE family N-acetylglucosaminyl deacetylase
VADVSTNLEVPGRALAIAAHPDDVEFNCGGTFAKWSAAGCVVNHLICTDGSKGSWDPSADLAALIALRQDEQRAAARALGSTGEVGFCGWVDGELEADLSRRGTVAWWIRHFRPDVVLAHDPWQRYRLHPDHRAAGFLACDGIVAARDPHFYPEHDVSPWRPSVLLLFEADEPDHVEDVTGFTDPKLDALECHESQFETTMFKDLGEVASEREGFRVRERQKMAVMGELAGFEHGESFRLVTDL